MNEYLELSYGQVAMAAALILINAAVSLLLRLRMEFTLLVASLRTIGQLVLVGLILESVFRWERWYLIAGLAAVMTLIAGLTSIRRADRRYLGLRLNTLISIWASSWLVTLFALTAVLRGDHTWYAPQFAIPLLGMILGNTLNGITVGINSFTEALVTRRDQVETLLALGATRWEAAREPLQHAVRTGTTPIINSMLVVGIVSLPGMMTGQLLSGMNPVEAVKYQIVIMFLIASATALGTVGIVLLSFLRLFNANHQFRFDALD